MKRNKRALAALALLLAAIAAFALRRGAAAQQDTQTERSCTFSISCAALLDHLDELAAGKAELVPPDGWLFAPAAVPLYDGESVFDVLRRVCREAGVHMEFTDTPLYESAYVEGIGNLYEFDCGARSGWMYAVNDVFPNYGCGGYAAEDGDVIRWVYTCDLGADVGGWSDAAN